MEISENGFASGSLRDLLPVKRFKYAGSHLRSTPCVLLPAKKRVFPPASPEKTAVSPCLPVKKRAVVARPLEPQAAAIPACLPVKKRTIVAPAPEGAVSAYLPAKKRAYASQPDAVSPACLPAKKRACAPPLLGTVASTCVLTKKRVHAPEPRDAAGGSAPVCLPARRVSTASPVDTVASTGVVAKKRIHAPGSRQDAAASSAPVCLPANRRVSTSPPVDTVASAGVVANKRIHAPGSRQDAARSVPVCLPANKRVMPPFVPPPSVESGGARFGIAKQPRPEGSNKHGGGAINARVANGTEGCARGKEFKKPEKAINPKGIKEQVPIKLSKPRSPSKAKDLEKKACKIVDDRQSEVAEVRKKSDKAADARGAVVKEESRSGADEVAQELEQEAVEEDDGVLCAVCRSTDGDPSDPIVFCDGCDLMVHASCYGNPLAQAIPDGDWFCSLCSAKKSKPAARPSCCLCPARGGAMKRTTEGQWAHIACALLVPEVFFRDPDGRDGVDCSRVPAHRFAKDCYICESSNGCALECSQPKCGLGFHVSCGLDGGLCIEYREGKCGAIVAGFCREHTELWEKQQLTGKYKIVARGQE